MIQFNSITSINPNYYYYYFYNYFFQRISFMFLLFASTLKVHLSAWGECKADENVWSSVMFCNALRAWTYYITTPGCWCWCWCYTSIWCTSWSPAAHAPLLQMDDFIFQQWTTIKTLNFVISCYFRFSFQIIFVKNVFDWSSK